MHAYGFTGQFHVFHGVVARGDLIVVIHVKSFHGAPPVAADEGDLRGEVSIVGSDFLALAFSGFCDDRQTTCNERD
jgi:hypothetical protein